MCVHVHKIQNSGCAKLVARLLEFALIAKSVMSWMQMEPDFLVT